MLFWQNQSLHFQFPKQRCCDVADSFKNLRISSVQQSFGNKLPERYLPILFGWSPIHFPILLSERLCVMRFLHRPNRQRFRLTIWLYLKLLRPTEIVPLLFFRLFRYYHYSAIWRLIWILFILIYIFLCHHSFLFLSVFIYSYAHFMSRINQSTWWKLEHGLN